MPTRPSSISRASRNAVVLGAAVLAGVAAALAPATLTGNGAVDALERFAIVTTCSYVGAHGRRWTWIVAAGLIVVPARGHALWIAVASLAVLVPGVRPRRRSKEVGAIGLGILANVPFWYGPGSLPFAPFFALAGFALLITSGRPFLRRNRRRTLAIAFATIGGFVLLALAGVGATFLLARSSVTRGSTEAQHALDAARAGDSDGARAAVGRAQEEFDAARDRIEGFGTAPASIVPGLAQEVKAARAAVDEGRRITDTADDLVATADYDDLTYSGRLDLPKVRQLVGPTKRTATVLHEAADHLDHVRAGWLLPPLQDRLDDFAAKVADARKDSDLAAQVLDVTPGLFGGDGDRRYLVVFITPAELRGAGGFIGSYAELTATDGKVRLTRSGRILDLIRGAQEGARHITGPADYIRRYERFRPEDFLQDVTFSPDFPSDASVLQQLYPQSGGAAVDGVISVDPRGLAALLKLTGPVKVRGLDRPLRADNAEEVLLRTQYLSLPDEAERGEILTEATKVTFTRLTEGSLPAPRRVSDALSAVTREGHLRLWSPDDAEEAMFKRLGADGSLVLPESGDGFSVVQQNVGNNKLDAYLHRRIDYHAAVDARTGELDGRLVVELHNDVPGLQLPAAVVGNARGAPVGTNLATLTVLTRQDVTDATIDGRPLSLGRDRERGLNAFDTPVLRIAPGATVTIVLRIHGGVDLTDGYDLAVLPQPTANADVISASLTVRGGRITGRDASAATLISRGPSTGPTWRHVDLHRSGE